MKIKVFGPGCARCSEAEKLVKKVVAEKGSHACVEKVSDLKEMMAAGIMSTPAVTVDGVVKVTGRVPTKEEISGWIDGDSPQLSQTPPAAGSCCCGGKC